MNSTSAPDSTCTITSSQSIHSQAGHGAAHDASTYQFPHSSIYTENMARQDSREKRRRIEATPPNSELAGTSSDASHISAASPTALEEAEAAAAAAALAPPIDYDHGADSASLTSSIRQHNYEYGLRYHGYRPGLYSFPNDEAEQERDVVMHELSIRFWEERYFLAPVEKQLEMRAQVLDLATGIGIWCEQMADKYPLSSFEGIDLSPIQSAEVPPNVRFYVDDMEHEQGWNVDGNKFDFIHLRHTLHSVRNMPELFRRAYEHLKPGGYFEVQEVECIVRCDDGTVKPGHEYALRTWLDAVASGLRTRCGSDLRAISYATAEMRAAGFEVEEHCRKCPVGTWAADERRRVCGGLLAESLIAGIWGLSARPLAAIGWTRPQIEMLLVTVRDHVRDPRNHAYMNFFTIYGRKPLE
ncbi:hypothetical protein ACRALDRAFT_1079062 [Sodiomyces alcalophilus JCM 7366]|uniref:uncharacterized protein n=1 Tax=Sodiomyces alcalophilus JCM 7366 TaxID=591952 RepID=UPI0039B4F9D6